MRRFILSPSLRTKDVTFMQTQNTTTLKIEPTQPGRYRFRPPFKNKGFLDEFKKKIGPAFRCWNVFQEAWDLKPLDQGHLDLIVEIAARHFERPVEVIAREEGHR